MVKIRKKSFIFEKARKRYIGKISLFLRDSVIGIILLGLITSFIWYVVTISLLPKNIKKNTEKSIDKSIDKITFHDKVIVAYNSTGNKLWAKEFDGSISTYLIVDLDNDGNNELLCGIKDDGVEKGAIYLFSCSGREIWHYKVGANNVYRNSERFIVDYLFAEDLNNDTKKEIIAISHNTPLYPHQLLVLNYKGQFIGEYWNPGNINPKFFDVDNDGYKEILCSGLNNDLEIKANRGLYGVIFFLLDSRKLYGQAPPYYGRGAKGSHRWYGYFTSLPNFETAVADFRVLSEDNKTRIMVALSDERIFYLDEKGNVKDIIIGDEIRVRYSNEQINKLFKNFSNQFQKIE